MKRKATLIRVIGYLMQYKIQLLLLKYPTDKETRHVGQNQKHIYQKLKKKANSC